MCDVWQQAAEGGNLEAGHLSDATASGPASDDEASSMAATVGSMLHTSPADREGSGAGSDSGGSPVDSVSGTTQSTYIFNCNKNRFVPDLTISNPATAAHGQIWELQSLEELVLGSQNSTPDETNDVINAVSCYKEQHIRFGD